MVNDDLQMTKQTKIFIWIFCITLLACNIILLLRNKSLHKDIYFLEQQVVSHENIIQTKNIELKEKSIENTAVVHPDIELSRSGFSLLVLIPEGSCSYLKSDIPIMNKLYTSSNSRLKFRGYVLGGDNSLMYPELYGAEFPYKLINYPITIDGKEYAFKKPTFLLVDSRGVIQKALISKRNDREGKKAFYQLISSFISD